MPIISIRDNGNNRWKRNAKKQQKNKNKDRKGQGEGEGGGRGGAEAIVKVWELNDFAVHLS